MTPDFRPRIGKKDRPSAAAGNLAANIAEEVATFRRSNPLWASQAAEYAAAGIREHLAGLGLPPDQLQHVVVELIALVNTSLHSLYTEFLNLPEEVLTSALAGLGLNQAAFMFAIETPVLADVQ